MAHMSEFTFLSSDGQTALYAREYLPEGEAVGIVQLVHGIAEHIARYDAFASFLAGHGYIVVMHDQLGHGKSAPDEAHLGFFNEENGWEKAVQDIRALHDATAAKFPGKPYFLFGHSMGSFLTRTYLIRFRTGLDGVVISGTGHQNPALVAGGKTTFSAAAYCSRIAGMLAGTPAQCSATYAQLSEVTSVTATENPDAAVDAGKLFIIDDGRVRKLSRAVTSKVTIGDTEPEALKKIKMTAAIDLIRYYAVSSVEDDYFGKCANTYDDKCVLLLALQDYLKSLEDSKVLESGSSGAVLDADATRKYLITAAGDDATEAERIKKLSDNEVIKENTGSKVFLKLYGNIMDAMEDFAIVFEVSPSVIAA